MRARQLAPIALCLLITATIPTPALSSGEPVVGWSQPPVAGTPPAARYSAGSAYDAANDRLLLFSGEADVGLPRLTDVWVLADATGAHPSWLQLAPTGSPPPGMQDQSVVYAPASNSIIVYGGCQYNCGFALSGVWVLSNANGLGGTPAWSQPAPSGAHSTGHAAVYDDANDRMIVFGGDDGFNHNTADVRILAGAGGTGGSPSWTALSPAGALPASRVGASAAYDAASNRMIVFGGIKTTCCASVVATYNDAWVLTNANGLGGTPQWTQLAPAGAAPPERSGHSSVYDPATNRLIVFGGLNQGGPRYVFFDDAWVLTNANGLGGTPQWIKLAPTGGAPAGRFLHSAGYRPSTNSMVIAMGRNDTLSSPLFNDHWVLTNANGAGPSTVPLQIDVKPGSSPNAVNPRAKGVIPVAVLTTSAFDARTLDPATVAFGPAGARGASHVEDVDADGDLDLLFQFRTQDTGIRCGDASATLAGATFGGSPAKGTDAVATVGC